MNFEYSRDDCLNLENAQRREWLETNGLGSYASSTIIDCHTRKYHGLLVAPVPALDGKFVFLSKLEASLHADNPSGEPSFHLSTNKYPGVFHPTGHKYIDKFNCELYPEVRYRIGDILFTRAVLMPQGEHTVLLRYELLESEKPAVLHLSPLLAYRNMHALTRNNMFLHGKTWVRDGHYMINPFEGMPSLFMDTSITSTFHAGPYWVHNIEYLKERSRGYDYSEDLFCPGIIELRLKPGDVVYFRASLTEPAKPALDLWNTEIKRRKAEFNRFRDDPLPIRVLKLRAEQFLIRNSENKPSIVAGYHWFNEWGRDAMIALPGLTLACGRDKAGMDVLETFAAYEKDGLIPNFIALDGKNHAYNSADAALWFFWAAQQIHARAAEPAKLEERLFTILARLIGAFLTPGRVPHVWLREDGLLWVGDEKTQLTWMDAKVNGIPVTPRHGLPVEINALWYNALCFFSQLSKALKIKNDKRVNDVIKKAKAAFVENFWLDEAGYLADVVNDSGRDTAIRPNQIFAASLPYSPLNQTQKKRLLTIVEKHLLTPYGLRTLDPLHPDYKGEYSGSQEQRDAAYHQGTVWPWLIGHFIEGRLAVTRNAKTERARLCKIIEPLYNEHLRWSGIGGISEIFAGNPPHMFKGCIHQAWSVGEALRAYELLNRETNV